MKKNKKENNILRNYCFKYTCKRCPRSNVCIKELEKQQKSGKKTAKKWQKE